MNTVREVNNPNSGRRLGNLEIIRFAAATMVVFFHVQEKFAIELGALTDLNTFLGSFGAAGVDIFFVVSGFVIALNISNPALNSRSFIGARISRIVPSYWLLTILAALTMLLFPSQFQSEISYLDVLSSLFFVNTYFEIALPVISMGWTLNLEIFFYLIVTLAIFISRKHIIAIQLISVGGLLIAVFVFNSDALLLEFIFGFIAYWLWQMLPKSIILAAVLMACSISGFAYWLLGELDQAARWQYFGLPAFFLVLSALVFPQTQRTLVKKLGFASYSIYLTQWFSIPVFIFIMNLLNFSEDQAFIWFFLCITTTVVLGVIYSELVDKHLYQFSRKFLKL